jgi:hypothetical protein
MINIAFILNIPTIKGFGDRRLPYIQIKGVIAIENTLLFYSLS